MAQPRSFDILARLSSIRTLGFGLQYFPRYVHTTLDMHRLDVVLMSVIVRGRGRHVMGDREYQESRGSIGITHYGQVHDILTSPAGMEIWNVYLDLRGHTLPELPQQLHPVLSAILPLHPRLGNRLNRSIHFSMRDPQRTSELLARVNCELRERPPGYQEAAQLAFRLFLIECCRDALASGIVLSPSDRQEYPDWLEQCRRTLDEGYAQPIALHDLAEQARVSKGHLCRWFKAYTGKTVFQYLIERRIGQAMLRLQSGEEKVLAIALACGFNDIAYFNRAFKRVTGDTPRGYRTKMRAQR